MRRLRDRHRQNSLSSFETGGALQIADLRFEKKPRRRPNGRRFCLVGSSVAKSGNLELVLVAELLEEGPEAGEGQADHVEVTAVNASDVAGGDALNGV